ncbi:MAG: glycosyltransferase [Acidobacteria bacterium]|nr:glycosyltransferase [Acidobacteriota bacterium]
MHRHTILHTIETSEPGGAETVVLDLASKLDATRFRSIVLLIKEGWLREKLEERGVRTILVDSGVWYDFRLPRAIARVVRQEKVDLIHSHLPDMNFYSCLAGAVGRRKTITTYHGPIEISRARGFRHAVKLWVVRRSAVSVVVVCDYVGAMLQNCGFTRDKIVKIYNGINIEPYGGERGSRLRAELGVPLDTKLVGMIAHLHPAKGYEFFIQAARKVVDALPKVRFVAVGEIKEPIWEGLSTLIKSLDLGNHIHFLGLRDDIPSILNDLDVFALSSLSEGFPLAVLEAMAAGKPVVVTQSGGTKELVEDGRTGFLVPPGDSEALAARIREVLADPVLAAALGRAARHEVEVKFPFAKMVSEYESLYERCLMQG